MAICSLIIACCLVPSPACLPATQVSASITGRFGSKVRLQFLRPSLGGGPPLDVRVILTRGRRASFADTPSALGTSAAAETTTFVVPPGARPGELAEGPDELGRLVTVRGPARVAGWLWTRSSSSAAWRCAQCAGGRSSGGNQWSSQWIRNFAVCGRPGPVACRPRLRAVRGSPS